MPMTGMSHDATANKPGGTGKVRRQEMRAGLVAMGYAFDGDVRVESPLEGDGTVFSRVEVNGEGKFQLEIHGRPERVYFEFVVEANSFVRTSGNVPLGCVATLNAVWEVTNKTTNQRMQRQTAFFTNTVQDEASWLENTGFELHLQPGPYAFHFTLVAVALANASEHENEVAVNLKRATFKMHIR